MRLLQVIVFQVSNTGNLDVTVVCVHLRSLPLFYLLVVHYNFGRTAQARIGDSQ